MAVTDIGGSLKNSVDGYVAQGADLKGVYLVVKTTAERDAIPKTNIVEGSLVYVSDNAKAYRWNQTEWVEEIVTIDAYTKEQADLKFATIGALDNYVEKEHKTGSETDYKVLSDNNYSNDDVNKLAGIESGAQVNPSAYLAGATLTDRTLTITPNSGDALTVNLNPSEYIKTIAITTATVTITKQDGTAENLLNPQQAYDNAKLYIDQQLESYAPTISPVFTGTVTLPTDTKFDSLTESGILTYNSAGKVSVNKDLNTFSNFIASSPTTGFIKIKYNEETKTQEYETEFSKVTLSVDNDGILSVE